MYKIISFCSLVFFLFPSCNNQDNGVEPVSLPVISVKDYSALTSTSFFVNGDISSTGNSPIVEKGTIYRTANSIDSIIVYDGEKDTQIECLVTGLNPGTEYQVSLFAVNAVGTAIVSLDKKIKTLDPLIAGLDECLVGKDGKISLKGSYDNKTKESISDKGFYWSLVNDAITNGTKISLGPEASTEFKTSISIELQNETLYYFVSYLVSESGVSYSPVKVISGNVVDLEGNTYRTIYDSSSRKLWMAENLKVTQTTSGDHIPQLSSQEIQMHPNVYQTAWNFDMLNLETYGRLYSGTVLEMYSNVCPQGWHLPSEEEFNGLTLKHNELKESGYEHWKAPNVAARNLYNFAVLPAGYISDKGFVELTTKTRLWLEDIDVVTKKRKYVEFIYNNTNVLFRSSTTSNDGYSIRCVKSI